MGDPGRGPGTWLAYNVTSAKDMDTMHVCSELVDYTLANRLLLLKCYDIKKVKSPGCSSIGMLPCG